MDLPEEVLSKLKLWASDGPHTFHGYETEKFYNLVTESRKLGVELTKEIMIEALVMHNGYTDAVNEEVAEKFYHMYVYIVGFLDYQVRK